jgi:hypothetical protein
MSAASVFAFSSLFPSPLRAAHLRTLAVEKLERGLDLSKAMALNINATVWIRESAGDSGEGGPQCWLAGVAGAALSLLDGLQATEHGVAWQRARKLFVCYLLLTARLRFSMAKPPNAVSPVASSIKLFVSGTLTWKCEGLQPEFSCSERSNGPSS